MCSHINVGSGKDLTDKELADTIRQIVGLKERLNLIQANQMELLGNFQIAKELIKQALNIK